MTNMADYTVLSVALIVLGMGIYVLWHWMTKPRERWQVDTNEH